MFGPTPRSTWLPILLFAALLPAAAPFSHSPQQQSNTPPSPAESLSCDLTLALPLPHPPLRPLPPLTCGGCDFGSLPGWWDTARRVPTGNKWNIFDPACQPQNLISKDNPLLPETKCPDVRPKTVLLLGDSVDRGLLEAVSEHWEVHLGKCGRIKIATPACGEFVVATIHLHGSSLVGPWHYNITVPYTTILSEAMQDWRQTLRLPDPDLVVVNSNMWDITRAFQLSLLNQSSWWRQKVLPRDFLDSWTANTTHMVQHIQQMFPDAVLGWHTVAAGSHKHDGTTAHMTHGRHSFVVQLNAAGRALSSRLGLLLLDYESLVAGFPMFSYLKDLHHPTPEVQLEVANLYLNLLEQLPRLPQSSKRCANSGDPG